VAAGECAGRLPSRHTGWWLLDADGAITVNFPEVHDRRSIAVDARDVDALRERLDRLCLEAAELRTSRKRLVLAADADRMKIERDLHESVQQHLVALAVNLQVAGRLADTDPAAVRALLEEMERNVQQAHDDTAQLAQRIYPPLLEARGLAAALRSAAVSAGIPVSVEVATNASYPPDVAATLYLCCLEALEHVGSGVRTTVTVHEEGEAVAFEVVDEGVRSVADSERLRDRVEALGGRLTIRSEPGRGTCVSGSLPLSR
jgi:signal transduction histidine kinase